MHGKKGEKYSNCLKAGKDSFQLKMKKERERNSSSAYIFLPLFIINFLSFCSDGKSCFWTLETSSGLLSSSKINLFLLVFLYVVYYTSHHIFPKRKRKILIHINKKRICRLIMIENPAQMKILFAPLMRKNSCGKIQKKIEKKKLNDLKSIDSNTILFS